MFRYVYILTQTCVCVKAFHPTIEYIGRGFLAEIYKDNVEKVAYLPSDAYLSEYGLEILKEVKKGTDALKEWIDKQYKENLRCYGKKEDPCKDFALNWIKPDQKTRQYTDWSYAEYGYIYDEKTGSFKVYNDGTLLFNIKADDESIEKYLYLFEHDNKVYHALSYNAEKLADVVEFVKTIKTAAKMSLSELKELVKENKGECIYLDDYHCITGGHRHGHEVYSKPLRFSESSYELEFIVEHDQLDIGYTDYGWEVLIQLPYCRTRILRGKGKYGNFRSEKTAVDALREHVNKLDPKKLKRTAEIFDAYMDARRKSEEAFKAFLDTLESEWEKEPWYVEESFTVRRMIDEGKHYLYLKEKNRKNETA